MHVGRLLTAAALVVSASVGVLIETGGSPVAAADIASVTCAPVTASEPAPDVDLAAFDPQLAERVVDTRIGTGGVTTPLGAGCTLFVDTTGIGPADATAFALSVTVISTENGFFTAFPCAAGRPGTSSVNARPGFPTANLVVATPDSAGRVCLYSDRGGNVVVDVSGWWAPGPNRFTPIAPTRAYDTRALPVPEKLPEGAIRAVDVGGVVVPDDAVAVTVNVAAVAPDNGGFLVVYPCGSPVPLASNLNFKVGEKRAVSAFVELGSLDAAADGRVCVSGSATTHFILDVTGYVAPSSPTSPDLVLQPSDDVRVVDSREPGVAGVRFQPNVPQRFDLRGALARPDDAVAVVLNVVAVRATTPGFLSVTPCQPGTPATSSLNYDLAQTSNLVVTSLTGSGEVCISTSTAADVVVDLVGAFVGPDGSLVNQLSLTDATGEFVPLDQDFDVDGVNSTLHCDGALNARLRLGLALGVSARVNGLPVPERSAVDPDRSITIPDEGLLTVELTRGSQTAAYYVRCLPEDFSDLEVTRTGDTAPGWYLTETGFGQAATGDFMVILDERGVPVWFKRNPTPALQLTNPERLSTGEIVLAEVNAPGFGVVETPPSSHRVYGLDGTLHELRRTDDPAQYPIDHHDHVEIPASAGGGYAAVSYHLVKNLDLTSGVNNVVLPPPGTTFECKNGQVNNNGAIVDNVIREMDPVTQTLRWSWSMRDHFNFNESTFAQCFKNYPANEVDVFHINSLQRVDDGTGDYIVSARHADAVFRVRRSDGEVPWILGGRDVPNQDMAPRLNIVGDPLGGPLRMHDARLVGNLLTMYDNRTADPGGHPSRAVAYRIDTTGTPDQWSATLVWQISHPTGATSGQIGSVQVTPDGSVLVDWGATQPMFVEYASPAAGLGELMRIRIDPNELAYRIVKYAPGDFDAAVLRATAGGALQQPSP